MAQLQNTNPVQGLSSLAKDPLEIALLKETSARSSADTSLLENITASETEASGALAAETSNRIAADTSLQAQISQEVSDRTAGDLANANAISNEVSIRASADSTLQTNITNEATARTTADNTLQTEITSETTNRTTADTALQSQVTANTNNISEIETDLGELQTEIDATNATVTANASDITSLKSSRTTDEANIATNTSDINSLKTSRTADETNIAANTTSIAGLSAAAPYLGHFVSGSSSLWLDPFDPFDSLHNNAGLSTQGSINNALIAFIFKLPKAMVFDQAQFRVAVNVAASTCNVAAYSVNSSGVVGSKLYDIFVAQETATLGNKLASGLSLAFARDLLYAIVFRLSSGGVSLASWNSANAAGNVPNLRTVFYDANLVPIVRYLGTDTSPMPSTFPASPTPAAASNYLPEFKLRISSQ